MSERLDSLYVSGTARFGNRPFRLWILWLFFLLGVGSGILYSPDISVSSGFMLGGAFGAGSTVGCFALAIVFLALPCFAVIMSAFSLLGFLFLPCIFFLRGFVFCFAFYFLLRSGFDLRHTVLFLGLPAFFSIPSLFFLGESTFDTLSGVVFRTGRLSLSDDFIARATISAVLIAAAFFVRAIFPFPVYAAIVYK